MSKMYWFVEPLSVDALGLRQNLLEERQIPRQIHSLLTQLKKNISIRKMHWLAQGLRKIKFWWSHNLIMATQNFKGNLVKFVQRRKKKYFQFVSSCCLREIKISDTCRLFPPFGDPWPSCLLPSQYYDIETSTKNLNLFT